MEGKEAIIAGILEKAELTAKNLVADAEAEVNAAVAKAQDEADGRAKEALENAERACGDIVARRLTLAQLDARKLTLAAKRRRVDEVYGQAAQAVRQDAKRYDALLRALVSRYAEDGDTVVPAAADQKLVTAAWVKALAAQTGKKLTRAETCHFDAGGIILAGGNADKNLTLTTLLKEARAATEGEVVRILFGDR